MTTEPRQEAERLVWEYRQLCESDMPFPHDEDGRNPLENGLVDALEAAITTVEHYTNGSSYMEQVLDEQVAALSALREDET